MAIKITPDNKDDKKSLRKMIKSLKGKCYAEKGYLGKGII